MKKNYKYNVLYSTIHYLKLRLKKEIHVTEENIGRIIEKDTTPFTIFKEIYLQDGLEKKKHGNAIFQIIFYDTNTAIDKSIKKANHTIPFFIGLPGFCNKNFMINTETQKYSGLYEWETIDAAKKYANSYAVRGMKRVSSPHPISYTIIDKSSGRIVESKTL